MHEMSLVRSVVSIVTEEAEAAGAAKVTKVHIVLAEGRDIVEDLFESLRSRGILIRDCSNYRGLSPGYWRVAVRCPSDNRRLIRELRKALGGMVQDGKSDHDTGNHVQCG